MRGMRRGSGPQFFSEGMTPTYYGRLLARIGVARIYQRVGAPRGGSRISGWGDDGGAEGPERGAVGAKRRSTEGVGSGEGRRSPSPVRRSGGITPRKFLKFNLQICAF